MTDEQPRASFPGMRLRDRTIDGFELRFDGESTVWRSLRSHGVWERHLTFCLTSRMPSRGVFFDVGANVGYHSILVAKAAPGGRVVAFEPQPEIAAILRSNAVSNGCGNVEVVEQAVAAATGSVTLVPEFDLTEAAYVAERSGPVAVTTLDAFCRERRILPNLIKTDVQGLDLEVIWGGRNAIATSRPFIVVEFGPGNIAERSAVAMHDVFEFLASQRYTPHFFRGHTVSCLERISYPLLQLLADLWIAENPISHMDVAFIPG